MVSKNTAPGNAPVPRRGGRVGRRAAGRKSSPQQFPPKAIQGLELDMEIEGPPAEAVELAHQLGAAAGEAEGSGSAAFAETGAAGTDRSWGTKDSKRV